MDQAAIRKRYYDKLMANPIRRAKLSEKAAAFRARHPELREQRLIYGRNYRKANPDRIKTLNARHYAENAEKRKQRQRELWALNEDRYLATRKERFEKHPICKLIFVLRIRVRRAMSGNMKSVDVVALLGCSHEDLRRHIESQFKPGMCWENYGRGDGKWTLDHIRPLASFNLILADEQRKACHFSNLSPEWWSSNLSKTSHWQGKRWTYKDHQVSIPV